jgi:hypothetical protein
MLLRVACLVLLLLLILTLFAARARVCCRYDFFQVLRELELDDAEQGLQALADAAFRWVLM